MGCIKSTFSAVCAATLLTVAMAAAQGTLADRKTIVTFSGPVSLPGMTLPAGTYVFKLAESPANRNIVQIFDKDEAKIMTTLLAVAAERAEAEGDPVVSFKETASDRPPAVRYWYYAGEKAGNEFIYPRAQAMMIARASGESVSAFDTDSNDLDAWKKGEVTKVTATTTEPTSSTSTASTTSSATTTAPTTSTTTAPTTSTTTAPTTTAPTTTAPTTTAPVTEPPPPPATTTPVTTEPSTAPPPATAPVTTEPAPVGTSGRVEALPHTASQLPLVGLIGLLALTGAIALGLVRRAIA